MCIREAAPEEPTPAKIVEPEFLLVPAPMPVPKVIPPPVTRLAPVPMIPTETEYVFEVSFVKRDGGLGVDLSPHDGVTFLIGRIKPWPFEEWNMQRGDETNRVSRGDRIIAVNSVSGNSDDILSKMRADHALNFTIYRLLDFMFTFQRLDS